MKVLIYFWKVSPVFRQGLVDLEKVMSSSSSFKVISFFFFSFFFFMFNLIRLIET